MDLDTFVLAIAEISQNLYPNYYDEKMQKWLPKGPKGSLLKLINDNLYVLDN